MELISDGSISNHITKKIYQFSFEFFLPKLFPNNSIINCPYCQGRKVVKNGHRQGKQNYLCSECGHQPRENPCPIGLSYDTK